MVFKYNRKWLGIVVLETLLFLLGLIMSNPLFITFAIYLFLGCTVYWLLSTNKGYLCFRKLYCKIKVIRNIIIIVLAFVVISIIGIWGAYFIENELWLMGNFGEPSGNRYVQFEYGVDSVYNFVIIEFGVQKFSAQVRNVKFIFDDSNSIEDVNFWYNSKDNFSFDGDYNIETGSGHWYEPNSSYHSISIVKDNVWLQPNKSFYVGIWSNEPLKILDCLWQPLDNPKPWSISNNKLNVGSLSKIDRHYWYFIFIPFGLVVLALLYTQDFKTYNNSIRQLISTKVNTNLDLDDDCDNISLGD